MNRQRNPIDNCYDLPLAIMTGALDATKGALRIKDIPRPRAELEQDVKDLEGAIQHLRVIRAGGARNIIALLHSMVEPVAATLTHADHAAETLVDINALAQMMTTHAMQRNQAGMIEAIGDMAVCLISMAVWAKVPFESCLLAVYDGAFPPQPETNQP